MERKMNKRETNLIANDMSCMSAITEDCCLETHLDLNSTLATF